MSSVQSDFVTSPVVNGEPRLRIENLSKTFPGVRALRNVSLDVRPGEVHALVGANGSGKSTLIKVLAGVYKPDPGSRGAFDGEEFLLGDMGSAGRVGLRFVHQDKGLVLSLDSGDNFALGSGFVRGPGRRIRWSDHYAATNEAITSLGFKFDVRRPVSELGVAERTGLAIARCLKDAGERMSVLVLDEPTASFPKREVDVLFDVVKRVRESGVSVIYVSHHIEEIFVIADRVTVLRDGQLAGTFEVASIDHDALVRIMVGEIVSTKRQETVRDGGVVLHARGVAGSVLRDFDLQLQRGEIVGIAGVTGSGREEVAPLIFGGMPRGGAVRVNGKELPPSRPDMSVELGVGLVPADRLRHGAILDMNLRENLTLVDLRSHSTRTGLSIRRELDTALNWLGRLAVTPPEPEIRLANLSGGNQQKVIIGRWLMRSDLSVLILDEPTQGVDIRAKGEIYALVRSAAANGVAVLVCSSDEGELAVLCDRVIVLTKGEVVGELRGESIDQSRITSMCLLPAGLLSHGEYKEGKTAE